MGVDFSQLKKYSDNFKKLSTDAEALMKQFAYQEGEAIVGKIKDVTPVDTGLLRVSWHSVVQSPSLGVYKVTINNNVKYASYVENGHRIVNKKGQTVGWCNGRFMMRRGINFYVNNLMKLRFQRFMEDKAKKYLG